MNTLKALPTNINSYDYIFIGCGLSTATVCAKLPKNKRILIIEKREHIGGNVYDHKKNDILVHQYGPHIFHTNDKEVFDFLNQFTTFNSYKNIVQAKIDDELIPLPVNVDSIKILFPNEAEDFINYLKEKFPNQEQVTILELSQIDKYQHIYQTIYTRIFASYTGKMWDKKIEDLDVSVFARVPIYLTKRNTYFTDTYEGLPTKGYTQMVLNMLDSSNIDIVLNINITKHLQIKDNQIYINDELITKPVINCAPIDEIFGYKYDKLPYRSLNIKFEELNNPNLQTTAVVNYPEHPKMTRITEYKNFYPEISNDKNTIISKEFPGAFEQNSKEFSERYYPIPNDVSRDQYNKYVEESKKISNLYQLGRLAQYRYINMDQAVRSALDFADELIKKYEI
ncbi:UDP-galactopyranose mutase [Mycoplasma mycoides]|uniref:UDP-galactopyranose mutase n=1 Tax=Mycoplasma mycoides TaxID=2102 RepID=UPI0027356602|nr:UDP-galactopyranose mutase [Mycoplasma mycoides]MDP4040222.1 UDP-galactopyranose mutase [Mycoplasma mycoides]MDP4041742.1 UDP-galactopyranose mutase [Mycoplasma mycoides]MDP4042040.1 UDP-galactopyranose mutase [Mycoplasma mycoides]MDP4043442.1 UDP-galactopyranose mutase [Mycoplasma mycoides]MDP4044372.1 UDP-galactopyranose mutase [Mycoplasma mycoides]